MRRSYVRHNRCSATAHQPRTSILVILRGAFRQRPSSNDRARCARSSSLLMLRVVLVAVLMAKIPDHPLTHPR
jgi:hypothetical protein